MVPNISKEGVYFTLSYKGVITCIDSGIKSLCDQSIGSPADQNTIRKIDKLLMEFLDSYETVWYKDPRTGEVHELEKLTCCVIKDKPEGLFRQPCSVPTLTLSPHFKVPNHAGKPQTLQM